MSICRCATQNTLHILHAPSLNTGPDQYFLGEFVLALIPEIERNCSESVASGLPHFAPVHISPVIQKGFVYPPEVAGPVNFQHRFRGSFVDKEVNKMHIHEFLLFRLVVDFLEDFLNFQMEGRNCALMGLLKCPQQTIDSVLGDVD